MRMYILYTIIVSFFCGILLKNYTYNWHLFIALSFLTCLSLGIYLKMLQSKAAKKKYKIDPKVQYWENIYFYLTSFNLKNPQNELRIWCMNIEDPTDFTSFVELTEQIATKSLLKFKFLTTHTQLSILESLIRTPVASKIRFSQLDPATTHWPFKNKFDIIYVGKIPKLLASNPNFHRRIESHISNNAVIITDLENNDSFNKKSWQQILPGIFALKTNAKSSDRSNFDLRNDLSSNFI